MVWIFLQREGAEVLSTKEALQNIVFFQYIPRFVRLLPIISDLKKSAGVFAESTVAGAAYYLLWYLLASHVSCYGKIELKSPLTLLFIFGN